VSLSICIVAYQARSYLEGCLESIEAHPPAGSYEVIVVDNGSTDGTAEMVRSSYPRVRLIENRLNAGYAAPMNQALRVASGDYLLMLNPDTLVHPAAFERLLAFMEAHPEAGICGPKVLNTDGTLQKPCRRGEPTPWAVISYFLKLSALFPRSKFFGGYLMNYLGEDEVHTVAGVSGSCMLVRRQVIDRIGYLDEQFFAYQEDADICRRARQAGWEVYYVPEAQITHYGGEGGSRAQPYRSIYAWHRSYYLYYRKHLAANYFFLFNWLYYLAMLLKLVFSLGVNLLRREKFAGRQRPK
jgi:GT2 family glycosyltransferase